LRAQQFFDSGEARFAEEQGAESGKKRSRRRHIMSVYIRTMNGQKNQRPMAIISETKVAALRAQFERCKKEIGRLDWLSEGSVSENHPGTWRWTRKVKAKTVTVALSAAQAGAFEKAIANHRRLEALIQEMRARSQQYLLEAIAGPPRRRPREIVPNPS
jgi:hypothetical protein